MAPSASLLVPFEADTSRKARQLASDVQQIVKQKGAFRHVTEETLLTEIARPDESVNDDQSDHSTDTEPETRQATLEKLFATKAEINKLLQLSMNETNTLLDLVSWALSGSSKVAQTTMSPALKGGVPVGSAEMKIVPPPFLPRNAKQRLDDTSNIVRLQAFEKCSERLLSASNRLQTEAQHQSKYWDQMAKLRSQGWPISRLPRDGRSLVVHVASAEAPQRYRNKGLLPLKRDDNGDLSLPDTQFSDKQQRLAVLIRRGDRTTGYFSDDSGLLNNEPLFDQALIQAKEVVLEEELFSEASKEAQLIANLGARVRSTSIEIDITPECSMSITFVPRSLQENIESHVDDDLAAFIGSSLKTMLVAEHENKYRTRSSGPPLPMTLNPRTSPEYVLLRPIIAQVRHNVNTCPVIEDLQRYQASLNLASLSMSIDTRTNTYGDVSSVTLQRLRQITISGLNLELPSGKSLDLNIETQLAPPRFGTQFNSTGYKSECGSRALPPTSSSKAAMSFLADVIARDVCRAILDFKINNAKWQVRGLHPLELVLVEDGEPRAMLATSCRSGSLAVSMLRTTDGTRQKVIYEEQRSVIVHRDGRQENSTKSLEEILESWVAGSTKSGT